MSTNKRGSTYELRLDTEIDLSTASPLTIDWTDPDGNTGSVAATPLAGDDSVAVGEITVTENPTTITQGQWKFVVNATIGSNVYISTETFELNIKKKFD